MGNKFIELLKNKNGVKIVFLGLLIAFLILAGGLVGQVHADIPAIERAALIAFYNSTDGDNWINNTGWKIGDEFAAPGTECTSPWYGVVCSGGHVIAFNLEYNQLSGNIPAEIGNLTNLQYFGLHDNQLTGSIPAEIGNLSNLHIIYLDDNQLTGSIPSELGNLTNLEFLHLFGNQLTGSIPPELGNLTNLQDFRINTNQLTGSIPAELGNLTNLQFLFLYTNQLTGNIPAELGSLSNLWELILHDNQLTGSIPAQLGNLTSLEHLHLNDNQLSSSIPVELGNLVNLQVLLLHNNELTCKIPDELVNMTSLSSLSICGNHLYTTNSDLRNFLNNLNPNWESCQTMPFSISGSVMHKHKSDGMLYTEFEVVIGDNFVGTLPDDIDTITIVGPSGILPYNKSDFVYWPQWKDFSLIIYGSPEFGEYTFTVTSGAESSTAKDTQSVNRIIPNVDSNTFSPTDKIKITTKTPTFSWQLVDFPETAIYYRLKIYDEEGYRVFASPRQLDLGSLTIPAGTLVSGQTYTWRLEATDSTDWLEIQNLSDSEYQTFYVLYGMPWINLLLLDY